VLLPKTCTSGGHSSFEVVVNCPVGVVVVVVFVLVVYVVLAPGLLLERARRIQSAAEVQERQLGRGGELDTYLSLWGSKRVGWVGPRFPIFPKYDTLWIFPMPGCSLISGGDYRGGCPSGSPPLLGRVDILFLL